MKKVGKKLEKILNFMFGHSEAEHLINNGMIKTAIREYPEELGPRRIKWLREHSKPASDFNFPSYRVISKPIPITKSVRPVSSVVFGEFRITFPVIFEVKNNIEENIERIPKPVKIFFVGLISSVDFFIFITILFFRIILF
jgi:hypothetical protein